VALLGPERNMTANIENGFDGLDTPCLLLDRARLAGNIARFEQRAKTLGVGLRPHMKTAKSADVAALIPSVARDGITVSTLKEAEYFAEAGLTDIFYAVCIAPQKIARAAALVRAGVQLTLAVDDVEAVRSLIDKAQDERTRLAVMVEVDCGEHRSGVAPESTDLIALAAALYAGEWTHFAGVFTHGGHAYEATDTAERSEIAHAERDAVITAARRLSDVGLACETLSVGSTPTFACVDSLTGITEARPGVYVFGDLFQAGIGSCKLSDIAVSVLTTVIGCRTDTGRLLVDAGALALSKDRSTAALPGGDRGYGQLCDLHGKPIDGLIISEAFQEHGVVSLPPDERAEDYPVGTRLRVLPNHACTTAAAYDRYQVLTEGGVTATWPRVNEWS
jgi:D-serine deaminase-like pyridoxal phosphate-dependent protein